MSFLAREIARWLGAPVELYRFVRQGKVWRYTSADAPVTAGDGETFRPIAIARAALRESYEREKRKITITLPLADVTADGFAGNWFPVPPGDVVAVTIMAMHRGEADTAIEWIGRVIQPRFTDSALELTCDPGSGAARPNGLQLRWQRSCPYALYAQGNGLCNLRPQDFAVPARLIEAVGNVLRISPNVTVVDGRLAGGYIEWTADGLIARRSITNHYGTIRAGDVALLHFDGEDGATVFPDEAGNIWTPQFGAALSTAQAIFGGASLLLDGASYITTPPSPDFDLGLLDFTIEAFVCRTSDALMHPSILANRQPAFPGASCYLMTSGNRAFRLSFGGNTIGNPLMVSTTILLANQWYHVAVTRQNGVFRMFIDGQLEATATKSAAVDLSQNGTAIGNNGWDADGCWSGYIDELRVTKGAARYVDTFTPPDAPFAEAAHRPETTLVVDYVSPDFVPDMPLTAYHGCMHTYEDCEKKGNDDNYGGCTNLPTKNPFSGNPIWW